MLLLPSVFIFIFILFIFTYHYHCHASNIPIGSILNTTTIWTSPNNTFTLSFIPIPIPTLLSSYSYSAAISFSGIPVWKAGGDSALVDSSARLQLLTDGNLRLSNGNGSTIWESRTSNQGITLATLDDSGNLSLKNNRSVTIWSTFQNPTDTLLPNQTFTPKDTLQSGVYSFALLHSGNLTLRWNTTTVYWSQGPSWNGNLSSPSLLLQQIGILQLSDPTLSAPVNMQYSSDYGEGNNHLLRFLRLDSDGNLRMYTSVKGSGIVTAKWAAVIDQCRVYGCCGNMGVCSYNDSKPVCACPSRNFELVDPGDSRKGCKRTMELQDCPSSATMLPLENTQFLTYQPELSSQVDFAGTSGCIGDCLQNGSCVASTSLADGSGQCYLKFSSFVSGYQSLALPSTSYVKVCSPQLPNPSPSGVNPNQSRSNKLPAWVVAVVVVATLIALLLVEGAMWLWCCRNSPKFGELSAQYALLEYASGAPVQFSYKELQRSTKGFREKLGSGGFGAVYRGVLANRSAAAVKQLEGIEQGEKQFRMEVATISSTHHLNLVRLIGFCSEGRHRLLVYEYMKNGSLDDFLFVRVEQLLNWQTRYSIALGTARGITYLHEECRDCIVHCDIKPENILLDENFNAKVSDFGLAKLINSKDQRYRTLTSVRGTRGYLAPEWLANLPITSKSDIYSYGMVLLEIVSGRRNFEVSEETNRKKFSMWAYEEFERGNIKNIVDKRLGEDEIDMEQVKRAIETSFWCIQEQPSQRPTMGKVVQMLEGITDIGKPPAPKATATEGSVGGTSIGNASSSVSALSIFATSAQAPSSSSSSLQLGASSISLSGRNTKT